MKIGPDLQQYQVIRPLRDENAPLENSVPFDMKAYDFSKMGAIEAFNLLDDLYGAGLMTLEETGKLGFMICHEVSAILGGERIDTTKTFDLKTRMQNAAPWYSARGDDSFDRLLKAVKRVENLPVSK